MNNLSDVAGNASAVMSQVLVLAGVIFVLIGFFNLGRVFFDTTDHPDAYMSGMMKGMFGILGGGLFISYNLSSDTVGIFKYIGIGIGCLVVAGIVGAIGMFILSIKKYKKYIKKTNDLLLLTDDFLVLSSNLQTIEDQIVLNSKMAEALSKKKKEELTFLNSLLTEKRVRFNSMIADVRASVSL